MRLSRKASLAALVAALLLPLTALSALAQSPVAAEVDRTRLSTDESLVLTVRVSAESGGSSSPVLPPLDGFRLDGSSSGQTIRFLNGAMTIEATYQYRLTPTQIGDLVIGPVTVEVGGVAYSTDPIAVEVVQGTGQPQPSQGSGPSLPGLPGFLNFPSLPDWLFSPPGSSSPGMPLAPAQPDPQLDPAAIPPELTGQDLYVESAVDKLNPYQGEGVIHAFRFYQAVELFEQSEYQPPSFTGFWHEQIGEPQVYTIEAAGRTYRVTEILTSLFPTVVGEVEIEPARLSIPASFFRDGQLLGTQPIQLDVRPLPPGAPAGFRGAVGQFSLAAEVDQAETQVNDTVTLNVTLSGAGNLETAPDPAWTEGPDWRAFDTEAAVETWLDSGRIHGTRRYERTLVPTTPGDLTLPPVEYVYFDPQSGTYETASTGPIAVHVAQGESAPVPGAPSGDDPGSTVGLSAPDGSRALRPNKDAAAAGGRRPLLPEQPGYWILWGLPVLLLVGQFAWQAARKRRQANPAARRSQAAARKARQALRAARRTHQSSGDQAGAIMRAYLEEKLDRPVAGLTEKGLSALLVESGVDLAVAQRVVGCLRRSDSGRYAPEGDGSSDDLLAEAGRLIGDLEKCL